MKTMKFRFDEIRLDLRFFNNKRRFNFLEVEYLYTFILTRGQFCFEQDFSINPYNFPFFLDKVRNISLTHVRTCVSRSDEFIIQNWRERSSNEKKRKEKKT